ncbi:hypothetical protein BDR07DRAFT_1481459 [Suillus spraguei]|nr:hypothetical protein BDR07DRAFT_1481459 [Suillus spraguei]
MALQHSNIHPGYTGTSTELQGVLAMLPWSAAQDGGRDTFTSPSTEIEEVTATLGKRKRPAETSVSEEDEGPDRKRHKAFHNISYCHIG